MSLLLRIQPTSKTPFIEFNPQSGMLLVKGHSYPEDPQEFYQDLIDAIDVYCLHPLIKTTLVFNIEYLNTGTSRVLYSLFKKFEASVNDNKEVEVIWQYEEGDDDILDAGIVFSELSKLKFTMTELPK